MESRPIRIVQASTHNLQNITIDIPRGELVLVSGPSGSGKSSLVFDTLYLEGLRRVAVPLSGAWDSVPERPAVKEIQGLSFPVAFLSKTSRRRYLSHVLTLAGLGEDWGRILLTCAQEECIECGASFDASSLSDIENACREFRQGKEVLILSPLPGDEESRIRFIEKALTLGYVRALGESFSMSLEDFLKEEEVWREERVFVHIDTVPLGAKRFEDRLRGGIQLAEKFGGLAVVRLVSDLEIIREMTFATSSVCFQCGSKQRKLQREMTIIGRRLGSCQMCGGAGVVLSFPAERLIKMDLPFLDEGILVWRNISLRPSRAEVESWAKELKLPRKGRYEGFSPKLQQRILFGKAKREVFSVFPGLEGADETSLIDGGLVGHFYGRGRKVAQRLLKQFSEERVCPECDGALFCREILHARLFGQSVREILRLPIGKLRLFFSEALDDAQSGGSSFLSTLSLLDDFGLSYLSLVRASRTLSAGEEQRVELARELRRESKGMMYLLDEPSSGLHPSDLVPLVNRLHQLKAAENAVVVVDHHEAMFRIAEYHLELGPGAGERGGSIVYSGKPRDPQPQSENLFISPQRGRESFETWIQASGLSLRNLKGCDLRFPAPALVGVCGVSGSGKSTAIFDCLAPAILKILRARRSRQPTDNTDLSAYGVETLSLPAEFCRLVEFGSSGRRLGERSKIADFLGLRSILSALFAMSRKAKTHGFTARDFLGRTKRSKCKYCEGRGRLGHRRCLHCDGSRIGTSLQGMLWRDVSFISALRMSVEELREHFSRHVRLAQLADRLVAGGLGYLRLNQEISSLSSGERQRILLAQHVFRRSEKKTIFLLDEPCRGLGEREIPLLEKLFSELIAEGHAVVVIEHRPDFLRRVDYLVEFGPGAGSSGGEVLCSGTFGELNNCDKSIIKNFLKCL